MNTITYSGLKSQRQTKHDELFTKCGAFWAFSTSQFEEGKKKNPLLEGEKYASIGMGGYIRNSKLAELNEGMKDIAKWMKEQNKAIKADQKKREAMIVYELANYEAWYTNDITDAFEVLKGEGITKEEVLKVYSKNYKLRTANL